MHTTWLNNILAVLCRHFRPAPYQVLQELMLRAERGEAVDAEAALQPEAAKPGRSRMDLANRLRLRKERQRLGHTLYSGFVPPYNTQSRVFDSNELRRAASQVCVSWAWAACRQQCWQVQQNHCVAMGSRLAKCLAQNVVSG